MAETFTVLFTVDSDYTSELEDIEYKVQSSSEDPDAIVVIVPEVDEVLLVSLRDDELAEFFGIPSEGLIYTDRNAYVNS